MNADAFDLRSESFRVVGDLFVLFTPGASAPGFFFRSAIFCLVVVLEIAALIVSSRENCRVGIGWKGPVRQTLAAV